MMEANTKQHGIMATSFIDLSAILIISATLYTGVLLFLPLQESFEARYMLIIQNCLRTHHWLFPSLNGAKLLSQPPLYYLIAGFWSKIFGLSHITLRLFSLACALVNSVFMYLTLRYLLTRGIAVLSTIVLLSSFIFTSVAILAAPMQFALLLFSITLYALICLIYCDDNIVKRFNLCFWVMLALLTMTCGIYLTLLFLITIITWSLLLDDSFYLKRLHSIRGYILFLVIVLPWFVYASLHYTNFLRFYFVDTIIHSFQAFKANSFIPNWSLFIALLLGFMPWTIFIANAVWYNHPTSWQTRNEEPFGVLLIIMPCVFILGFIFTSIHAAWSLLLVPPLAIMCGRYLAPGITAKTLPLKNNAVELLFLFIIVIASFYVSHVIVGFQFMAVLENHFYQSVLAYIILSAIIILPILRYASVKKGIIALVILCAITYFTGALTIKYRTKDNNKTIAQYIIDHRQSSDIIASYYNYPAIIPLMLNRDIVIIDWQAMPPYAKQYQGNNQWLTTSENFWKVVNTNHKKIYLIIPKKRLSKIKNQYPVGNIIVQSNDMVLVSNE